MNKLLVVSAIVLLASFGQVVPAAASSSAASAAGAGHQAPGPARSAQPEERRAPEGTFMIGDSTTYRIAPDLHRLKPDWYLDYQRGRSIRTLPAHIDAYLRKNPLPANFVMALGTNRCHRPDWSEARLRRAIAKLPSRTNVFLVMVVRAGAFQADKDSVLQDYNRYSRDLARTRPHTYIIDWRRAVLSDPTLNPATGVSALLEDGTHESGGPHGRRPGRGVETYIHLVVSKWQQVNGQDAT